MKRRLSAILVLCAVLIFATACTNKKVTNPLADLNSKQPDKVLFDRALDALKHNKFEVARLSLQTLINTYPDSEYIARAKLGVADSWYAEGGSAAYTQAEIEYKDFQTFFPNMAEAAEAQYKIANIHYQEMEKPDRDFTHALRAEDEYRQMILQYPDSKLLPQAKQRLLEVQEVLGEREFRVGRFYYLRESYPAAIARLRSMAEKYPLYSKSDEAYYLLGQSYETQIARIHAIPQSNAAGEAAKAKGIKEFSNSAAAAYAHIVERYPMGLRADAAKLRLEELHHPAPTPTPEAIARNKKEMEGREQTSMVGQFMGNFKRHPDVKQAAKVGDPALVDPQIVSATQIAQETVRAMTPVADTSSKVSTEAISGTVKNEAPPRSDAPPNTPAPEAAPGTSPAPAPATGDSAAPAATPYGELKPDAPAAPTSDAPAATPATDAPPPAPPQTNEIQAAPAGAPPASATSQGPDTMSSSKGKKKKGMKKIIPF